ncbi:hypothetical protein L596_021680 [Steinernema carpocapsae]|uniref:Uncharacterized protein n=1 Tax=Steinernema carpocapsae TaxID=34508 RepID=A0A4V6A071_STECR|nr:hypothetical protein L596_021680 [Steinernema carpocapsae]
MRTFVAFFLFALLVSVFAVPFEDRMAEDEEHASSARFAPMIRPKRQYYSPNYYSGYTGYYYPYNYYSWGYK